MLTTAHLGNTVLLVDDEPLIQHVVGM